MRLSELADISSGYPFRGKILEKPETKIQVIQMKDINDDHLVAWDTLMATELTGLKKPDWLQKDDLLFAARGFRNYTVLIDKQPDILPRHYISGEIVARCTTSYQ